MAQKSSRRSSAREETSKWQKIVLWFHFLSSDRRQFFILQLQCHQFIPPKYQQSPLCLSKDSRERKKTSWFTFYALSMYSRSAVRPSIDRNGYKARLHSTCGICLSQPNELCHWHFPGCSLIHASRSLNSIQFSRKFVERAVVINRTIAC